MSILGITPQDSWLTVTHFNEARLTVTAPQPEARLGAMQLRECQCIIAGHTRAFNLNNTSRAAHESTPSVHPGKNFELDFATP